MILEEKNSILLTVTLAASPAYDPVASAGAVVMFGHVRFTVLTDTLVRMERVAAKTDEEGDVRIAPAFEDRPNSGWGATVFPRNKVPTAPSSHLC